MKEALNSETTLTPKEKIANCNQDPEGPLAEKERIAMIEIRTADSPGKLSAGNPSSATSSL
jgi:hypothetical protein